jgi:hypothetical protein
MKSAIFCDITLCIPLKVNRRFGGTYRFHLQSRISRAKYQRESKCHAGIFLGLFDPEYKGGMFL